MEILIDIPPFLQPYLTILASAAGWGQALWNQTSTQLHDWSHSAYDEANWLLQLPKRAYVTIFVLLLLFWPVLLNLILALATAWTWIFWLLTSIVLGHFQMLYVAYQFIMIAIDILGLSVLKTYSMMRNQVLFFLDKLGLHKSGNSRRRLWRAQLEEARTYERYSKLKIQDKDEEKKPSSASVSSSSPRTLPRVRSYCAPRTSPSRRGETSQEDVLAAVTSSSSPTNGGGGLHRNRSFSGESMVKATFAPTVDLTVAKELGEKTADLLVTTTARLKEARLEARLAAAEEQAAASQQQHPDDKHHLHSTNTAASLLYILSGVVKRNHLNLDDTLVENARNVAESGQYGLSGNTRRAIHQYYDQVERGLEWIADSPIVATTATSSHGSSTPPNMVAQQSNSSAATSLAAPAGLLPENATLQQELDRVQEERELLSDRITLIRKMKQNMGRTALMLSGGGAQAMYHLGIIRALVESNLYEDIKVISGTSGGSIAAAMCAVMTRDELLHKVCVNTVSTDFGETGEQARLGIRWFPALQDMATYWLKHKLLVDSSDFRKTCEYYYADITFEEAFEKTQKHVCITVSASRASDGTTAQRLLLNHISTPHVTLASAVAASCALPGVMAPAKLVSKSKVGALEPFEVDGVEWIDGSVQADLPFQRISTLFCVSSFIVSQTNFHIVPFLNKSHHPNSKSFYWRLFQTLEWDIRSRALKLSRLGLFPRMFGQDISKVFKQRYHGNLTIVPRFTTMQTFGLKALSNPTKRDMDGYLKYGQIATWPYLQAIADMIRLERKLDECLHRLEERIRSLPHNGGTDWSTTFNNDDVESIASSSAVAVSFGHVHHHRTATNGSAASPLLYRNQGRPPLGIALRHQDSKEMQKKMTNLEQENQTLRQKLEALQALLQKQGGGGEAAVVAAASTAQQASINDQAATPPPPPNRGPVLSDGSEGEVWSFILNQKNGSKTNGSSPARKQQVKEKSQ